MEFNGTDSVKTGVGDDTTKSNEVLPSLKAYLAKKNNNQKTASLNVFCPAHSVERVPGPLMIRSFCFWSAA